MRKNIEKVVGKIKSLVRKISIMGTMLLSTVLTNCCLATSTKTGIESTKLVQGTEKLIGDVTNWLLVLAPVVTIVLVIYYLIRKSASDDMDAKRWDGRIKVSIISCIGVVIAAGLINVLVGYYQ